MTNYECRKVMEIGSSFLAQSPKADNRFDKHPKGGTGPPRQPCPLRTVTRSAAQVASQQSLTLRTGIRYHISTRQFKRLPALVFSNNRTWILRFLDHAEQESLSLFRRCATVPRLVWKKFFPRVAV